jgi:hypothetical protein
MSQLDPTYNILSVLGLIALTYLFLVTTHGPKTHLTSQQPALLVRPVTKSLPTDVRYYNSPLLRSLMTLSAQLDSQWGQLWYQMSQSGQTCQILSVLGLTALTDLFLVITHDLKTCLTSHQLTLLIRLAIKSLLADVKYYKIKKKKMLVRVNHMSAWEKSYWIWAIHMWSLLPLKLSIPFCFT